MAIDIGRVQAVILDSYSTLVDVESTAAALAPHTENPRTVARIWQLRSREYAVVGNAVGIYRPATERHRLALDYALEVHGIGLSDEERERILECYHDLDVFPDVPAAVERIRAEDLPVWILSSGDPSLLESLVETTDLSETVEDAISAEEIRTYKPDRELYEHAAARAGVPPGNALLVTASWSDVNGGLNAGMQAAWLNRKDRSWEPYAREPDAILENLHELADRLSAGD